MAGYWVNLRALCKRRRWPARVESPAGPWPVQLRYRSGLTGEQYVKAQGWRNATLAGCPHHPGGGCSFARHGTYARKSPHGTRIARWYCPDSHTTFSLLSDCLAARLPGTLQGVEDAVAAAEAAPSLAAAADAVRGNAVLPAGAMRWLVRRVRLVHRSLAAVRGCSRIGSWAVRRRWARSAFVFGPPRRWCACAGCVRSNCPCCPRRWGSYLTRLGRRIAPSPGRAHRVPFRRP